MWQKASENLINCKYSNIDKITGKRDNEIKVLSLNIRSLNKTFSKLIDMQSSLTKFDIQCFNETSCSTDKLPFGVSELEIEGFHTPYLQNPARTSNKGGGLAIYVNKKFCKSATSITIMSDLCHNTSANLGEHFFIEIDTGNKCKNVIIGNHYRSPSVDPSVFLEILDKNLTLLEKHKNKTIR